MYFMWCMCRFMSCWNNFRGVIHTERCYHNIEKLPESAAFLFVLYRKTMMSSDGSVFLYIFLFLLLNIGIQFIISLTHGSFIFFS